MQGVLVLYNVGRCVPVVKGYRHEIDLNPFKIKIPRFADDGSTIAKNNFLNILARMAVVHLC